MTNKTISIGNMPAHHLTNRITTFSGSAHTFFREHTAILLVLLTAAIVNIAILTANPGVKSDDAYIFFRYARNFAETGELVFNPGEKSVGYTSFAWMMLLAHSTKISGVDPVTLAKAFALIFHLASIFFLYRLAIHVTKQELPATLITLLYAMDNYVTTNAVSGMESAMGLCFYLGAIAFLLDSPEKRPILTGSLLLSAALTRPEYCVLIPAYILWDLFGGLNRGSFRIKQTLLKWLRITGIPAAGIVSYAVYLKITMGFLTPSTYIGKILSAHPGFFSDGPLNRLDIGFKSMGILFRNLLFRGELRHLGIIVILSSAVWFIPVVMDWRKRRVNSMVFVFLAVIFHFALYFIQYPTGIWRYHLHVIPIIYLAMVHGFQRTSEVLQREDTRRQSENSRRRLIWLIAPALGCTLLVSALELPKRFRFIPDPAVQAQPCGIAEWMNETLPGHSVVAIDMIGRISYDTRLPILDLGGLIDPVIWPCLENKQDLNLLLRTFASRNVTHLLVCDGHILWNFLPAKSDNFILIESMPVTGGNSKMFHCYAVDYSIPVPETDETADGSNSRRMPVLTARK